MDDELCKSKKDQNSCKTVQDKGCSWGQEFVGSLASDACFLDPEFDKFNCAAKTASQCNSDEFKNKCFYDEETKECGKLATAYVLPAPRLCSCFKFSHFAHHCKHMMFRNRISV